MPPYDGSFYDAQSAGSERSARVVLPQIFQLLRPGSVVDFGCGVGTWLAVAKELGARRVLGIDGGHVDAARLRIDPAEFRTADLEADPPIVPGFDLAISVEVAEHLREAASDRFVDAIAGSADAALFGAAIPGQQGVRHVNCQWQSWWARKFAARGFLALDLVRPAIWARPDVEYHYAQNTILYVRRAALEGTSLAARVAPVAEPGSLDLVHPAQYGYYLAKYWRGLPGLLRRLRARRAR